VDLPVVPAIWKAEAKGHELEVSLGKFSETGSHYIAQAGLELAMSQAVLEL
jgi:hypothetical protein